MTIAQRINYEKSILFLKNLSTLSSRIILISKHLWRIRAHLSSTSGVFRSKRLNHQKMKDEKVLA